MTRLDGRTILITGAARGLGRAHALLAATLGANVVVNDAARSLEGTAEESEGGSPADQVVAEISTAGGTAIASQHDITDPAAVDDMVGRAMAEFGGLHAVINNAGFVRDRTLAKLSDEEIRSVFDVHLWGSTIVSRAAMRVFKQQEYGRIVMTTSGAGLWGNPGQANYGAAKMALVGLTKVLAQEGRKIGVLVNAVAPAATTRMTESVPLGRISGHLGPELVSPLVAFLCSPGCTTSGEIYESGGGHHRRVVVSATPGWFSGLDVPATLDDIAEHWDEINDPTGLITPRNAVDANRSLFGPLLEELA